jgi:hypothetical protein
MASRTADIALAALDAVRIRNVRLVPGDSLCSGRHEKARLDVVSHALRASIANDAHDLVCCADSVINRRDAHAKRIVSTEVLPDKSLVDKAHLVCVGTIVL